MITQDDVNLMKQYGINTVRIPVRLFSCYHAKLRRRDRVPVPPSSAYVPLLISASPVLA